MIKKHILLLILLVLFLGENLIAQEYLKHEFSVGALVGSSSLKHKLSEGTSKGKVAGGLGFGYTYFFEKNMGLVTGVEFAFYNTDIKLNNYSDTQQAFDLDIQKDFEFRYTLQNYKETQNAFYLNLPIMFHYQFTDGENVKFYADAGTKIGLPINGKYKTSGANLKTSGYFPHDESTQTMPQFRGFGNFVTKNHDDELKYKMALNLALEVGVKWSLPNKMVLYTGVYMDYGLNDVKATTKSNLSLVQYNQLSPEDHIFNGVASSSISSAKDIVDKVNTMAYGVKVRFAFGR